MIPAASVHPLDYYHKILSSTKWMTSQRLKIDTPIQKLSEFFFFQHFWHSLRLFQSTFCFRINYESISCSNNHFLFSFQCCIDQRRFKKKSLFKFNCHRWINVDINFLKIADAFYISECWSWIERYLGVERVFDGVASSVSSTRHLQSIMTVIEPSEREKLVLSIHSNSVSS